MHVSTLSNLAILVTSLLAKDVLAAPYDRRDSPSSLGSQNSTKRGLAYNKPSLLASFTVPGSKAGWFYNWDQTPGSIPSGLEFVPMLHDLSSDKVATWASNANSTISSGVTHLQYINEPDMSSDPSVGGCDTAPRIAAAGFVANMMPFKGRAGLGSPAVSNAVTQPGTAKPAGIPYLHQFFQSCSKCHFDFVQLHWYGTDPSDFKKHVQDVRAAVLNVTSVVKNSAGEPSLWITEFGLNDGDPDSISTFLGEVMPWLDEQAFVERYAYQWVADGILVTGTEPNKAGHTFVGIS